jgi:hypothetical protein
VLKHIQAYLWQGGDSLSSIQVCTCIACFSTRTLHSLRGERPFSMSLAFTPTHDAVRQPTRPYLLKVSDSD